VAGASAERVEDRAPRVAITGVGPVCAAGVGAAQVAEALRLGEAAAAPLYDPREDGVPAPPFPLFRPDSRAVASLLEGRSAPELAEDPELRLALAAALLALRDAGIEDAGGASAAGGAGASGDASGRETALVATWEAPGADLLLRSLLRDFESLAAAGTGAEGTGAKGTGAEGTGGAGGTSANDRREALFRRFYARHKQRAYSSHSFLHLHLLARELRIHGHTLFLNNACASGLYALEAAASLLREGRARRALVIAAESPRFPTKKMWFEELGLYALDGSLRPFDAGRSGLVLGEGAAALVLEPVSEARRRGARIYGEYAGGHFNQEAWKVATPNFAETFHEETIRAACARAGIAPGEVDALCAHGAGTGLSDAYEAKAIAAVFGERPERPAVVALKGYLGHTLGACALLELAAVALALEKGFLPRSAGFAREDPRLKVYPTTARRDLRLGTVLKLANGFAGFNGAALVRRLE
jgi:3-oxoacyl-(acyl-carrier-protein) synthase